MRNQGLWQAGKGILFTPPHLPLSRCSVFFHDQEFIDMVKYKTVVCRDVVLNEHGQFSGFLY